MQGSEGGIGLAVPAGDCQNKHWWSISGNTAGSCQVAAIFDMVGEGECFYAADFSGYHSIKGVIVNPLATKHGFKLE